MGTAQVNDVVRFLNDTGGGRVARIEGKMAYVIDGDGFERPVPLRECVAVGDGDYSGGAKRGLERKREADSAPRPRHEPKAKAGRDAPMECDLHISALVESSAGMDNSEMLGLQLAKFRQVMSQNLRHPGTRVVFIHGCGQGVLREAILAELRHKYPYCSVQDASYQRYGFGATLVTIHKKTR